jgi:hypothetical protein
MQLYDVFFPTVTPVNLVLGLSQPFSVTGALVMLCGTACLSSFGLLNLQHASETMLAPEGGLLLSFRISARNRPTTISGGHLGFSLCNLLAYFCVTELLSEFQMRVL